MKKLVLAAFIFASTISSNVLADIKMGIILTFLIFGEIPSLLFFIGSFIVISSVILLQKTK